MCFSGGECLEGGVEEEGVLDFVNVSALRCVTDTTKALASYLKYGLFLSRVWTAMNVF